MSPPILFLVALLLAVAIAGEIVGRIQLDRASQAGQRVARARDDLEALLREQLADEIGLRGYVATADRSFLEEEPADMPFDARATRLHDELLQARMPDAAQLVSAFANAHATWTRDVEQPLLEEPHRPNALKLQKLGQTLLKRMRDTAKDVRASLKTADGRIDEELHGRIDAAVLVSIGTITLFAIAVLVLGLSRRQAVVALAREQSLVAALQQTLRVDGVGLPRTAVGYAYSSATREALVGGDLIDTWRAGDERGWFLIADASGKGIEAARHSAFVQYAIRALCAEFDDPARVLEHFNALFLATFAEPSSFVVAFLGAFDAQTGIVRYASAGHSTAFIVRRTGIEQLMPTGPIIGMDAGETYTERSVRVEPGDTIVLATDGLTECRDAAGDMLGEEGVVALLTGSSITDPQAVCDRLLDEAQRRARGEVNDDLAILVLAVREADVQAVDAPFSTLSG